MIGESSKGAFTTMCCIQIYTEHKCKEVLPTRENYPAQPMAE